MPVLQEIAKETAKTKKVFIKTYGCQMNVYDSDKMLDILRPHGFALTDSFDEADMVILNTCHIREKAAEKVYSELGRISMVKQEKRRQGGEMVVVVAGCVAQAEGKEVVKRAPAVDIVVGPQSYHNLPILLEEVKRRSSWAIKVDFEENTKFDLIPAESGKGSATRFLSIQEGCDKFCHFCVVPYTRGAEFSRPVSEVYREALIMASNGVKEITLLGQNVSGYRGLAPVVDGDSDGAAGDEQWDLAALIEHVARISGIERLRYTTSHPMDMVDCGDNLMRLHGAEPKLMPYLHLPVQSGSDRILKAMNRKHTREVYFEIIDGFRRHCPQIALSSDFIVGYPGESDQDFADTIDLVERIGYAQAYSFAYSRRPGTPADELPGQVPEEVKSRRLQALQDLLRRQQIMFNLSKVGETMEVIFEKPGKKAGQLLGKSPYMQSVICEGGGEMLGKLAKVAISDANQNSLFGTIVA